MVGKLLIIITNPKILIPLFLHFLFLPLLVIGVPVALAIFLFCICLFKTNFSGKSAIFFRPVVFRPCFATGLALSILFNCGTMWHQARTAKHSWQKISIVLCYYMKIFIRTAGWRVKMSCQHLEFSRQDYLLRCTLDTLTLNRYFFLEIELILSQ